MTVDIDSFNGLGTVEDYTPVRPVASTPGVVAPSAPKFKLMFALMDRP